MPTRLTRRRFALGALGLLATRGVPALAALAPATPSQPAGPFYPLDKPLDDDNDLTSVRGHPDRAQGQISDLKGRILDRDGQPLKGLRIEIWQCDANGRYRHPGDGGTRPVDPGFQGFGHTYTDSAGRYHFRTIRPMPYPGRTPHIHVAVYGEDLPPFVTQLYVAGEPRNTEDFLYRRIPVERRPLVTTAFHDSAASDVELAALWDIVLGATPE